MELKDQIDLKKLDVVIFKAMESLIEQGKKRNKEYLSVDLNQSFTEIETIIIQYYLKKCIEIMGGNPNDLKILGGDNRFI